jgi:phage tail-like protein
MASPSDFIQRSSRFSDYLSTLHFHLLDVGAKIPTVFNVSYGFRHCNAPEITLDTREVKEGNYEFRRHVINGATAGAITFQQGVQIFNSDMYSWIQMAIVGYKTYRRNLMLIQFTDISPTGSTTNDVGGLLNSVLPLNSLVSRVPGRAWMLYDCIPIHYRAATDFDPMSADISIMELSVQPSEIQEFSLGI